MGQEKILIVDNEIEIIRLLHLHLSREGYHVIWTTDSAEVFSLVQIEKPDLILLDIVMPELTGIEVCSKLREHFDVPIIFISCKNQDMDKVLALSIGGDDYITKPFSAVEVIARVKALIRRNYRQSVGSSNLYPSKNAMLFGNLTVDLNGRTVTSGAQSVYLTEKEFDILVLLGKYPNRVFTPRQIYEHLWNSYGVEEDFRTVMVHVSNLRRKLQAESSGQNLIKTVRGVGYKLVTK